VHYNTIYDNISVAVNMSDGLAIVGTFVEVSADFFITSMKEIMFCYVRFCLCLFVCELDYSQCCRRISMNSLERSDVRLAAND